MSPKVLHDGISEVPRCTVQTLTPDSNSPSPHPNTGPEVCPCPEQTLSPKLSASEAFIPQKSTNSFGNGTSNAKTL
jgi:hypothetical protein